MIAARCPVAERDLTIFARVAWRDRDKPFDIRRGDRRAHMYLVGKTGTEKSTLLASILRKDLKRGEGVALLDPHGDLVESVLAAVPAGRERDLVYFDVANDARPLAFNPVEAAPPARRSMAASGMLEAFKKLWPDSWGPRLEHILRHALLAVFELPEATLADVLRLLGDDRFRERAIRDMQNPQIREFWSHEYEKYSQRFRTEVY